MAQQSSGTIMMIRPASFGFNTETASNNVFQSREGELSPQEVIQRSQEEYDRLVMKLRAAGVKIISIADTADPPKTDAVFCNNWISTHADGRVRLYPMYSENRRLERRSDIISRLALEYEVRLDDQLLSYEAQERYLESTGSMIIDRPNKIIYACLSIRTELDLLEALGEQLGYEVVAFDAIDENGVPYYHTNVIMALGTHKAIICTTCIVNPEQRERVINKLTSTGKIIVDISREQVLRYAGNMLEVKGDGEKPIMVMSQSALECLSESQLHIIKNHNKIVSCGIPTIEKLGGGSVRCMMTEIYLPPKR